MQSQQKNPSEVLQSPQQQIGSSGNFVEPDSPPFSIRKYVLACRQKDIFHSWPFPEKYLQICLKHGINDVLPPLESHHSAIQSLRGAIHLQNNENASSFIKMVRNTVEQEELLRKESNLASNEDISRESSQDCRLSLSSNSCKNEENGYKLSSDVASDIVVSRSEPSADIPISLLHEHQCSNIVKCSTMLRHKRKKRKGKHKKRSMVDILAVAKPCTLENLLRINRLCCGLSKPLENEIKGIEKTINVENNCKSDVTEENSNETLQTDDREAADVNMLDRKRWVVKFKFNGYSSIPGT